MKIPITDQFLWDVYNFLEKAGDIADVILVPRTEYQLVRRLTQRQNTVFEKYRKDKNKSRFHRLIYRLKKNNFIKVKNLKNNKAIMITKKGINKALKVRFKMEDKKQFEKRKDGKWVMIIFDIPQKHKKSRDLLRSILQSLGYKMFQQSVWVTPYNVSKKTEELLQFYSLDSYIKLFIIEKI